MAAEITPTERALIDQAIAAGRVTRIPSGHSSEKIVWDGRTLVFQDPTGAFAARHAGAAARVQKRRDKVAELARQGMNIREIAEHLGVGTSVVGTDRQALVGLGILGAGA